MSHSLDGLNANSAKIICSGFHPFHREKQKIPDMELVIFAKLTKRFIIPLVRPLFSVWSSGVISIGQLTYAFFILANNWTVKSHKNYDNSKIKAHENLGNIVT